MTKTLKRTAVFAFIFILLGIGAFSYAMFSCNFNFGKIFYAYAYESKTYENDLTDISKIEVDLGDINVKVLENEESGIRVEYNEYENRKYEFNITDGVLTIKVAPKEWKEYIGFNLPLNNKATLYIPANFTGEINISDCNTLKIKCDELVEKIKVELKKIDVD